MYKVIVQFFDKEDADHFYGVGDQYPRPGREVDAERARFLLGKNTTGHSFIEFVAEEDKDTLTRDKINSMSTRELKKLAKENGFMGADQMVGFELKDALIEKLGL